MKSLKQQIRELLPEEYQYLENVVLYDILQHDYFKKTYDFFNLAKVKDKYYLYHNSLSNIENLSNQSANPTILVDKDFNDISIRKKQMRIPSSYTYDGDEVKPEKIDEIYMKANHYQYLENFYKFNEEFLDFLKVNNEIKPENLQKFQKKLDTIQGKGESLHFLESIIQDYPCILLEFGLNPNAEKIDKTLKSRIYISKKFTGYENPEKELEDFNKEIKNIMDNITVFDIKKELNKEEQVMVEIISDVIKNKLSKKQELHFETIDVDKILTKNPQYLNFEKYEEQEKFDETYFKKFNFDYLGLTDDFDDYWKQNKISYINGLNGLSYMSRDNFEYNPSYSYSKAYILLKNEEDDCLGFLSLSKYKDNEKNYVKINTIGIADRFQKQGMTDLLYREAIRIAEENDILILREKNSLSIEGRQFLINKDKKDSLKSPHFISYNSISGYEDIHPKIVYHTIMSNEKTIDIKKLNEVLKQTPDNYQLPQELEHNTDFSLDKVLDDLNKFKKTKKMKP